MTIVLPQLHHGDSSNLVIWSLSNNNNNNGVSARQKQPVHEFTGFNDVLLDFHWRPARKGGWTLTFLFYHLLLIYICYSLHDFIFIQRI